MAKLLTTLDNLISKYSDIFFRIIGIGLVFHSFGLILFGGISFIEVDTIVEFFSEFLKIALLLISIIAGILLIGLKIYRGWSFALIKVFVSLASYLASIPSLLKLHEEFKNDDGLFGLINAFQIDPLEEIRNAIIKSALLIIIIAILLTPSLLKKYKISKLKINVSICIGIVLSIMLILLKLDFDTGFI